MKDINNWQEDAVSDSGVKVPEWGLDPAGKTEEEEGKDAGVEAVPSVAETRMAELATETKVIVPEDPEKKAVEIEARLAEIRAFSHPDAKSLFVQKTENLKRRTNGEISGIELDQLDKEIDEKIKNLGIEAKPVNKIVTPEHPEETQKQESANIEAEQNNTETNKHGFEKLSKDEVFSRDIEDSWDLRQLNHSIIRHGDVTAKDGYVYKVDYLLSVIGNLKGSSDPELQRVTSTYGLRDKVKRLLLKKELGI